MPPIYQDVHNRLHKVIRAGMNLVDDQTASTGVELFPLMKYDGSLIPAGTRINWNDLLKRSTVDLWDLEINNPDNAPTLWTDVSYRNGVRMIPENIYATDAFALNELGWWKEKVYRSLRDGNVFNPDVTPEWWEETTI